MVVVPGLWLPLTSPPNFQELDFLLQLQGFGADVLVRFPMENLDLLQHLLQMVSSTNSHSHCVMGACKRLFGTSVGTSEMLEHCSLYA